MSSISSTQSDHDITFHIHETKPYRVPDVHRTVTIPFDKTFIVPIHKAYYQPMGYSGIEFFWVAQRQEWIGFIFTSYREMSFGPNEEEYYGPYVFSEPQPPPEWNPYGG